ncbi:hypothetical protein PAXRUDRAFT_163381, partial [Paxillus rubicundulus Ve08.2h10]
ISLTKKTLKHYYLLTDSSEVYHIAMTLLLQDSWIETAKDLVKDEFEHSYANGIDGNINIKETIPDPQENKKDTNVFDNLAALAPPKPADLGSELTCYLNTDIEHVANPITW